jgi:hypothetical protein
MKYQKPQVHDMGKLSFAEGACVSGSLVGLCDANGILAGTCGANGATAGACLGPGATINPSACSNNGILGTGAPNCTPHGVVAAVG